MYTERCERYYFTFINLSDPDGILQVVVATVAFGMGLDYPNVRRIIHWGASNDIGAYLQEKGGQVEMVCRLMQFCLLLDTL